MAVISVERAHFKHYNLKLTTLHPLWTPTTQILLAETLDMHIKYILHKLFKMHLSSLTFELRSPPQWSIRRRVGAERPTNR